MININFNGDINIKNLEFVEKDTQGKVYEKGDLHIHSTASDGCLNPKQIIILAKKQNIDTIAITDHNSVDGLALAYESGKEYGISIIPAVELSTRFNNEGIHILGYFRDEKFNSTIFKQILKLIRNHKADKVRNMFKLTFKDDTSIKYLSCSEGIFLLRFFGASVVLAHPVRISQENLPRLLNMTFDGIEAKYCRSNDYYTNYFINIALNKFSFYTGGSDFHTDNPYDYKHSIIGEPYLNSIELERFLRKSGALVLK